MQREKVDRTGVNKHYSQNYEFVFLFVSIIIMQHTVISKRGKNSLITSIKRDKEEKSKIMRVVRLELTTSGL